MKTGITVTVFSIDEIAARRYPGFANLFWYAYVTQHGAYFIIRNDGYPTLTPLIDDEDSWCFRLVDTSPMASGEPARWAAMTLRLREILKLPVMCVVDLGNFIVSSTNISREESIRLWCEGLHSMER